MIRSELILTNLILSGFIRFDLGQMMYMCYLIMQQKLFDSIGVVSNNVIRIGHIIAIVTILWL